MLVLYLYIQFRQSLAVDQGLKKLGRALAQASLAARRRGTRPCRHEGSAETQFDTLRISGNPGGSTLMQLRELWSREGTLIRLVYASPNLGGAAARRPAGPGDDADVSMASPTGFTAAKRRPLGAAPGGAADHTAPGWSSATTRQHVAVPAAAFPLVLLPVWFAVRHGLRPLQQLADGIARRGKTSDLSPFGFDPPYAELKPLTAALERMLQQLRDKVAQERAFVHDAAHELRTPMAVIAAQAHALAGAAMQRERESAQRPPGAGDCARLAPDAAVARSGLARRRASPRRRSASTWRSSRGSSSRRRCRGDGARHRADLRGARQPAGGHRRAGVPVDAGEPAAQRDPLCAARRAGGVTLRAGRKQNGLMLSVVDDGPGIPAAERRTVFERFYRGRRRHAGGERLGPGPGHRHAGGHRMGGQVAIIEGLSPGKGVGFRVLLP
jgi:two-component system sensor histidine kinase QseC